MDGEIGLEVVSDRLKKANSLENCRTLENNASNSARESSG